jgi:hypothetical protein
MEGGRPSYQISGWPANSMSQVGLLRYAPQHAGGPLSHADRQRVHRQQHNDQDEHAAGGGPDPGFHSLVDAVAATVKRRSGRWLNFRGHRLRPLEIGGATLTEQARPYEASEETGTEYRSLMKLLIMAHFTASDGESVARKPECRTGRSGHGIPVGGCPSAHD